MSRLSKILLAFILMLSLVLCFVACDTSSKGKDKDKDGDKDTKDDPKKNINCIVELVNKGLNLEDITTGESEIDFGAIVDELRKQLTQTEAEINFSATADKVTVNGYAGIKDSVVFVEAPETNLYLFIEDDFKLVGVSESDGEYYGNVETALYDLVETLLSADSDEVNEQVGSATDIITRVFSLSLPEMSKDDISHEDGRYYISEDYIEKTVNELTDDVLDEFDEFFADIDNEEVEEFKATVMEFVEKLGLKLWFHAENEKVTGFGISVDANKEFLDEVGMDSLNATIDINDGKLEVKADCRGEDAVIAIDMVCEVKNDKDGNPQKITMSVDATLPFNQYEYEENDEYNDYEYDYYGEEVEIVGKAKLEMDLTLDASKINAGGEVLTFDMAMAVEDVKAYVWNEDTFESEYSQEYTDKYANYIDIDISANVSSENKGDKIVAELEVGLSGASYGDNENISVEVELSKGAKNMPEIPKAVYDARQEALDEYEEYGGYYDEDYYDEDYYGY
ncbi:MAG: hypothetical protein E7649_03020 [Ruminococcaceae bacterium]|nr:hypothetical protein [Oscillospiraceae bacterium]